MCSQTRKRKIPTKNIEYGLPSKTIAQKPGNRHTKNGSNLSSYKQHFEGYKII